VYAIADALGTDPRAVRSPPLYEVADAPALAESFFGPDVAGGSRHGTGSVEFRYRELLVKVRSDGWLQVYESIDDR
jgi:hypothetical protein